MKRSYISAACLALLAAAPLHAQQSGIDSRWIDSSVRVQDDYYSYANGGWMKKTEIPADKSRWGAIDEVRQSASARERAIIEAAAKNPGADADTRKVADVFTSFLDDKARNAAGFKPLKDELAKVAAIREKKDVAQLIAWLNRSAINAPFKVTVGIDDGNAEQMAVFISQAGLGMPDRDYYLKDDAKMKTARDKYLKHIEAMLAMNGDKSAASHAADVFDIENALAAAQWSRVQNRDPVANYNKVALDKLSTIPPGIDWKAFATAAGFGGKADFVIVEQPSYITAMAEIIEATPMDMWKSYFTFRVMEAYAPYLHEAAVKERFAFTGTTLRGVPAMEPAWQRAVAATDATVGFAVGKLYVAQHFTPESKARMETLVTNLLAAFKDGIDALDWMGPETKREAHAKLASFKPYIGYPSKWRDYSALKTSRTDIVANIRAGRQFNFQRNLEKLGKPVDRDEWTMLPQIVNASYSPSRNSITFPAGILQPPFFNVEADDAANYGAIGAVIGHEISHGFDDQGSQYDSKGNLRNWWNKDDRESFMKRAGGLVKQYGAYSPVTGYKVNGQLTLGENIGDNSGLAVAYKAYLKSLGGKPAPVIDGLTGDQRFFLGFAQQWRGKSRDEAVIAQVTSDPHTPTEYRARGTVLNQPAFFQAFGIKEGDKMYLAPSERVIMW